MQTGRKHITLFEHQILKLNQVIGGVKFDEQNLKAFESYFGDKGVPYFSLIHNGVKFKQYVGVIQVGNTIIEVLPKTDNNNIGSNEKKQWRDILIDMLFAVGFFDITAPSTSTLKLKPNSILDLYFELFINEVEYLLNSGLIKKYRRKDGNVTALKGALQFSKHIQHNLTHQERFFVRHTTYDIEHQLHSILFKTIGLLKQVNTNSSLHIRIGALWLNFPEMPELKVTELTFDRIVYSRKTELYKKSIEIARLLLLQYHPDISKGKNSVLALMFDMNKLWEKFVYRSLSKHKEAKTTIVAQISKYFWKPESGYRSKMVADIILNKDKPTCVVLDTKWKNLNGYNPSPADLRQMYVYHEYYGAKRVALVYPGEKLGKTSGNYLDPKTDKKTGKECSIVILPVEPNINQWQKNIGEYFNTWIKESNE